MIIRKIDVQKRSARGNFWSRKNLTIIGVVAVFLLLAVVFPAIAIRASAKKLQKSGTELKEAFKKNDIELVQKKLTVFSKDYDNFRGSARWVYWAAWIPWVGDFRNGVEGGRYLVNAGQDAVTAIEPYADLIGFKKGQSSFAEKSADERLQTAVLTLDKVLTKLDPISENIKKADSYISKIDPNRYPNKIGKTFIRDKVAALKADVAGSATLFVDAKPLLKRLPEILGKDKSKTYLVLFQNDKERRATGGFLTSYAIFKVTDGKIEKQSSDDIYELDNSISSHPTAPDKILKYHKGVYQLYIRDSNLSPDFPTSLKLFESLYKRSGRKVDYDGIITLDSKVLVDMLTIFGDTQAGGIVFSAKEDKRCDCPQVLYTLFDIVDRPVNYVKEDRKGIMGQLLQALMQKVLGYSPSQYWGPFMQNTFQNLDDKHILVNFKDPDLQASIEKLDYGGRIRDFDGDYLHFNSVNFAGAKSNLFVTEDVTSRTTIQGDTAKREVEITFKNPYPQSDCNLERGGLCLNAPLRDWIRFYVPRGAKLESFTGSQKTVQTYDELGKTVFEGFTVVSPLGTAKVKLSYTVPVKGDYKLMIQKQPSADTETYHVFVNGKSEFDGPLLRDVVLENK